MEQHANRYNISFPSRYQCLPGEQVIKRFANSAEFFQIVSESEIKGGKR